MGGWVGPGLRWWCLADGGSCGGWDGPGVWSDDGSAPCANSLMPPRPRDDVSIRPTTHNPSRCARERCSGARNTCAHGANGAKRVMQRALHLPRRSTQNDVARERWHWRAWCGQVHPVARIRHKQVVLSRKRIYKFLVGGLKRRQRRVCLNNGIACAPDTANNFLNQNQIM